MNKNLRCVLVSINHIWRYTNTGIDQLAGYLRKKCGNIVDVMYWHRGEKIKQIYEALEKGTYDVIGFSVHSSNYDTCNTICKWLKENYPQTIIVYGGSFATMYYKEIFSETSDVNFITLGDGEIPFQQIIESVSSHTEIRKSHYIATANDLMDKEPYMNDEINWHPIYDYYENDNYYRNLRKVHCLQTKNNVCTGNCSFCTERKGHIRRKSVDFLIDEIKYVADHYHIKKFFFTDDNIMDPNTEEAKEYMGMLCDRLEKLNYNLTFQCYIKAISFNKSARDYALLEKMANVGFSTMFIGLEAGNGQDLLLYNKHTTVQDNYNIMDIIRQHDIAPIIGFINLNPYSTKKTLAENFRFLLDIKCANLFQYAGSCISLQRYSPLYLKVANDGLLYDTYSYKNTMEYEYKDDDVRNIAHFIMQELRPRVLKLDMEVDSLWQYYIECKKVSCDVVVYEDRILSLKREYLGKIQEFLYPLFVEGDIETTRSHSERYFGYFEKKQIEMLEIYKELVLCFREATVYD